jgi:hypothetical protein
MNRSSQIITAVRRYILFIAVLFSAFCAQAQTVLPLPVASQEQNQWCWAGVTTSVLAYYGKNVPQCNIAEYVRTVATWHSYGSTNCCVSASAGCNYWNYNWGYPGSIEDILLHFASISDAGIAGPLTTAQITTEIAANRVFIEHWRWPDGSGHFVVGHGINSTISTTNPTIYYMNPWPGEGNHFCSYNTMLSGVESGMGSSTYTWDGTNKITYYPPVNGVPQVINEAGTGTVYPNPSTGEVWLKNAANDEVSIYSTTGRLAHHEVLQNADAKVDLGNLPKGIYVVRLTSAEGSSVSKLVLE